VAQGAPKLAVTSTMQCRTSGSAELMMVTHTRDLESCGVADR